jgi:hypothetical protein
VGLSRLAVLGLSLSGVSDASGEKKTPLFSKDMNAVFRRLGIDRIDRKEAADGAP